MGQKEVKFMEHMVNAEGYRPDPANVEAVKNMKSPTNVKEVRRFLGMAGFYKKHIAKNSQIASSLETEKQGVRMDKSVRMRAVNYK